MKIKNSMKMIALSVVVSTLFVGCGDSDDNTVDAVSPALIGTFVDAPVQGIGYKTSTQNGFTDASGQFKYKAGEEVEFTLGNLSLGKGVAGALMTPYTISDNSDTATNIALLLQNFDGNRSNAGVLDLSKLQDFNFTASDFNLTAPTTDVKAKIDILFANNNFATFRDATNNTVLDSTAVKAAMDSYIVSNSTKYDKKFTQAYLSGKTLYQEYVVEPGITTYAFGTMTRTFTDKNQDSDTYNQTLTAFSAASNMLIIKDGKLYEYTTDDNGVFNDGINIFTITSVDETKIVTTMPMGNKVYTVNWYYSDNTDI